MNVIYTDGGRREAGYKGDAGDCVVRAIAITCQKSYQDVYDLVNEEAKKERITKRNKTRSSARTGVSKSTTKRVMKRLGYEWVPTMTIGSGCRVHLRADELPSGKIIVNLSKHVAAVIDGEIYDTHDPSRDGTRCVYGYWRVSA